MLLHQCSNAALETSSLVLPHNKDTLRSAPLDSTKLFGAKVQEVLRVNMNNPQHAILKGIAFS